jgi:hypothetical protein
LEGSTIVGVDLALLHAGLSRTERA